MVHVGRLYKHEINIILIILLSTTGVPRPKELSSDLMPYPKETSTLKVKHEKTVDHDSCRLNVMR